MKKFYDIDIEPSGGKLRMLPQRLDSFSKILIATGQINYMASSINGVNEQMKMTGLAAKEPHKEGSQEKDDLMAEVVRDLAAIMNKMGDLINGHDCICPIDMRVASVPFEIVVQGKDEVENSYDDDAE